MENKKNLIFWGIIILVGVGLITYGYFIKSVRYSGLITPTLSPDADQSPTPSPTPRPTIPLASPTAEPFLGPGGIISPANCQIQGETNFTSKDTFSSDTKISWQNIDSQGRLIKWHLNPKDSLAIGPNLFANLIVPNGEYSNFTIRLPENPIAKSYILTASVTYGQIVNEDVKVKEVNCTGQAKVNLNF